jgi:hypothetical protein
VEMAARKIFLFTTNLLGFNYSCVLTKSAVLCVVIFQIFIIGFDIYFILYKRTFQFFWKLKKFTIYTIIDVIQIELFLVLQLLFTIRAFKKRKLTKKIFYEKSLKMNKNTKSEKIFFLNLAIIIIVRALKIVCADTKNGKLYMTKIMFTELIFASSDFIFKFHISCLTANLNKIKVNLKSAKSQQEIKNLKLEILQNFLTKRRIEKRFSVELFITILYNYIQLIISLYWTFMRVKFKRLGRWNGKFSNCFLKRIVIACFIFSDLSTFLYPIQPILCLWCVFSTYEEYLKEVKYGNN